MTADAIYPTHKRRCPRCSIGFLLFDSSDEGGDVCINCGYRVPAIETLILARVNLRLPSATRET